MKIKYKVSTWYCIEVGDDKEVTTEEFKRAIASGQDLAEYAFEIDGTESEEIEDSIEDLYPEDNGGEPTIEWFDDDNKIVWDNVNGYTFEL